VLVAAVFLAMLTATTVLTIRQPSIRTDLRTGMVPVAAELAARSNSSNNNNNNNNNNRISNTSQNLPFVCPCSQPETSWCSYTTFYLLFPHQVSNSAPTISIYLSIYLSIYIYPHPLNSWLESSRFCRPASAWSRCRRILGCIAPDMCEMHPVHQDTALSFRKQK
jgi:hypothetical protein